MKRTLGVDDEYYKLTFCRRCKKEVPKKQVLKCKKEKFLLLCEECYTPIKASLAKCLPLMQKFSQR